jgi:hypothetical protein
MQVAVKVVINIHRLTYSNCDHRSSADCPFRRICATRCATAIHENSSTLIIIIIGLLTVVLFTATPGFYCTVFPNMLCLVKYKTILVTLRQLSLNRHRLGFSGFVWLGRL